MMNIAYFAQFDGNLDSGVSKKLIAQCKGMIDNGARVELILLTNLDYSKIKRENIIPTFVKFEKFPTAPFKNVFSKIKMVFAAHFYLNRLLKKYDNIDIVYFRNVFPFPFIKGLFSSLDCKKVIDIPSNNLSESRIRQSYLNVFFYRVFANNIIERVDAITSVTPELISLNFPNARVKKSFVIGNGIDVASIPLRIESATNLRTIRLICVANFSLWHGIDRLINGLYNYKGEYDIELHLVGRGKELDNLKGMVKSLSLTDGVFFHGFKTGIELDKLINKSDLAIGNLGTHRKGIEMTSPLKLREYCARGIPFIYTSNDLDFNPSLRFCKKFDSNDNPIDLEQIVEFVEELRGYDNLEIEMREYAIKNLNWSEKMSSLLNFFYDL